MKKLFLIPMAVCWLYFYSMVVVLFLILLAILGSVFVPNDVLTNLLGVLATLGDAGFRGFDFSSHFCRPILFGLSAVPLF
jgi:hypothetical protein